MKKIVFFSAIIVFSVTNAYHAQAKKTENYYNNISQNYNQFYDRDILGYFDENHKLLPLTADVADYLHYDFMPLIKHSQHAVNIGIIGDNNKRLKMRINSVTSHQNGRYPIKGTSWVKGNLCNFKGQIVLSEVYEFENFDYGVDDEYKNKGLIKQGIAVFNYQLNEDKSQKHTGTFTGRLYIKYYVLADNSIHYDNIRRHSDGYFNNLYYGSWQSYHSQKQKTAIWADDNLPNLMTANHDLNIGTGEFNPNSKYAHLGWAEYKEEYPLNIYKD